MIQSNKHTITSGLLGKNDFRTVDSGNRKYLFLADSLRFFKITNPAVEEYLRLCRTDDTSHTFLSDNEIEQIGNYLKQKDETDETLTVPDLDYASLTLNITGKCNLACKYCFANTGGKNAQTMTFNIAQKAIDNMLSQKATADEYSIFYFGGEPLLKKELLRQISEYAHREIVEKRNKKLKFLINTNATLIDKQAVALFKAYSFIVTVSIDGPREINDLNRVYSNGKGSYEKIEEGVNLLKKHGIPTQLRPTFNPKLKDLVSVFDFFENLELPYGYAFSHTTNYKSNSGDTYFDKRQLQETNREFRAAMDYFAEKIKNGEKIFCSELTRKINIIHFKAKRTHLCEAGRKSLAVDETGKYFACQTMIPHRHTSMGDVDTNLDDVKRLAYMAKDIARVSQCNDCTIRGLCLGGCEVERMNTDNGNRLNEQMCDLFKLEWENILYLYARMMDIKEKT